jgi:hypothetical protein
MRPGRCGALKVRNLFGRRSPSLRFNNRKPSSSISTPARRRASRTASRFLPSSRSDSTPQTRVPGRGIDEL